MSEKPQRMRDRVCSPFAPASDRYKRYSYRATQQLRYIDTRGACQVIAVTHGLYYKIHVQSFRRCSKCFTGNSVDVAVAAFLIFPSNCYNFKSFSLFFFGCTNIISTFISTQRWMRTKLGKVRVSGVNDL